METGLTVKNLQHHSWALMIQEQSRSGLSIRDWYSQKQYQHQDVLLSPQTGKV